jgi:DNA-binding NarL/FixJ family response regulator
MTLSRNRENARRVLLVDDNPLARESVQMLLRDHFSLVICATAKEAIDAIDDAIMAAVIDLKLPDMDGFELLERIRQLDEHMPVVIYSAYSDLMDPFELMTRYRPSGYIVKGLNDHKLVEVLKRAAHGTKGDSVPPHRC